MSGTGRGSRVGSVVGRYRLVRLIGRGGMGEVFEAEDAVKHRIVALKLLRETLADDPVFRKRLQREAHSAGRLKEPHVVPIHDYGEIDGLLYVEMRMIDGTDLRQILNRDGPLKPERAVAIIGQVASALDAAHEISVMHRDVKPENILVCRNDFAYLVDFGIANAANEATLTDSGTAVGTYAYMAPERFTNDEVNYRVDIYALSCVLHECLTGSLPYRADSVGALIAAHLMQPIPRPSELRTGIPKAFDWVIERGMAKKPEDRFPSAGGLALAAQDALSERNHDQATPDLDRREAATLPREQQGAEEQLPTLPATPAEAYLPAFAFHQPYPPPGRPPLTKAQRTPGERRLNPWVPIGAAAGTAVVLAGIWWAAKPGSPSAARTTTETSTSASATTAATTAAPGSNPDDARLLSLLPRGYSTNACQPTRPPVGDALSTVDCGPGSAPGAPAAARYSLFSDLNRLNQHFEASIRQNSALSQCPGTGVDSPTAWHYKSTPDRNAGRIACGTYNNLADVVWTKESDFLLGDAQGAKLDDLHRWWLDYA